MTLEFGDTPVVTRNFMELFKNCFVILVKVYTYIIVYEHHYMGFIQDVFFFLTDSVKSQALFLREHSLKENKLPNVFQAHVLVFPQIPHGIIAT